MNTPHEPPRPMPEPPECECPMVPPRFWTTHYGAVDPATMIEYNPECPVHRIDPQDRRLPDSWTRALNNPTPPRRPEMTDHPLTETAAAELWGDHAPSYLGQWRSMSDDRRAHAVHLLRVAYNAGRAHERAQKLPTEPGTVIVPADGCEYITATVFGETYRAREAILIGKTQWRAAWRSDTRVLIYVTPEHITPGPWKVDDR